MSDSVRVLRMVNYERLYEAALLAGDEARGQVNQLQERVGELEYALKRIVAFTRHRLEEAEGVTVAEIAEVATTALKGK